MTTSAGSLIDFIESITGQTYENGRLLNLLNTAQQEMAQQLRAPQKTVTLTNVTSVSDFVLPADAQLEGLLEVYRLALSSTGTVLNSYRIPTYDFDTASQFEPNWTLEPAAKEARFIVYDPVNIDANPRPVPPPSSTKVHAYRIQYVVRPEDMDALSDKPFNGLLETYATALAYRVAFWLTGDAKFEQQYQQAMRRARAATHRAAHPVQNRLYQAFAVKGNGSRR